MKSFFHHITIINRTKEFVCPATERLYLAELKLTFRELGTLDFTGFLECGVANTLQT